MSVPISPVDVHISADYYHLARVVSCKHAKFIGKLIISNIYKLSVGGKNVFILHVHMWDYHHIALNVVPQYYM